MVNIAIIKPVKRRFKRYTNERRLFKNKVSSSYCAMRCLSLSLSLSLYIYIYIYIYIYMYVCVCVLYSRDEGRSHNTWLEEYNSHTLFSRGVKASAVLDRRTERDECRLPN